MKICVGSSAGRTRREGGGRLAWVLDESVFGGLRGILLLLSSLEGCSSVMVLKLKDVLKSQDWENMLMLIKKVAADAVGGFLRCA